MSELNWETAGRLAWCALTETNPEDATPVSLLDAANAAEIACCDAGCSRDSVADCIRELASNCEKLKWDLALANTKLGLADGAASQN